ncbi:MAG: arylsulfatase [Bacteroidales bacterium]|nr:arylsulfatase [Bacteroidales bacterium]
MRKVSITTCILLMISVSYSFLTGCHGNRTAETNLKRPNIIYILADDLGYGDLSINGQTKFLTPNIDSLAKSGMSFTNHYSGSTVCAPSRCCLLTGKHTGHATIRQNFSVLTGERVSLDASDTTIAEILKPLGYVNGAFGKWGLGEIGTEGVPWNEGFDNWYGYINQKNAHFYFPPFLYENDKKIMLTGNMDGKKEQYSHDLIMDKAFDFIIQNKDQAFFIYLAITLPHSELLIPEEYMQPFRGKYPEKPFISNDPENISSQEEPFATYAAMVTKLDVDVGKLIDLLKENGLYENTIVMFASDNGPHSSGGADPQFFNSNGPFRGIKRDLYEGGIRTPFYVSWPGKIEAGSRSDHVSAFWDILPTIAEISGAPAPTDIDGISLANALFGKPQKTHDNLYWEFVHKDQARQAIRDGDWKLVRYGLNKKSELYNLETDPSEATNLAEVYPELVEELEMQLKKQRNENPDFPLQIQKEAKKK